MSLPCAQAEPKKEVRAIPKAATQETGWQKSSENVVRLPSADFARLPKSITTAKGSKHRGNGQVGIRGASAQSARIRARAATAEDRSAGW